MTRGDSEDVITQNFVQEFGTKVYAEPPKTRIEPGGMGIAERLSGAGNGAGDFCDFAMAYASARGSARTAGGSVVRREFRRTELERARQRVARETED